MNHANREDKFCVDEGRICNLLKFKYLACLLVLIALLGQTQSAQAQAEQCFTSLDGSNTYASSTDAQAVRDAIAAANPGDTIRIAGTCAGVTTQSGTSQVALITKTLTLAGGYTNTNWTTQAPATHLTILDALSGGRGISATQPLAVEHLIVQNGVATDGDGGGIYASSSLWLVGGQINHSRATGTFPNGYGGGAYVNGSATLTGTSFLSNSAGIYGGGVLVGGSATLTGTIFQGNTADFDGGGAYVFNSATMVATSFQGNTAGRTGGGAYVNGSAMLTGTSFLSNTASIYGGGAYVLGSATLTGTSFLSNTAGNWGGGALVIDTATLTGTSFQGNTATFGGGALYLHGNNSTPASMVNSLFARNRSLNNQGAALYMAGNNPASTLTLLHNTLANPTLEDGAAIYVQGGTVTLTNTIIANHAIAIERAGGTVSEDYSLFADVATPFSGMVMAGSHSITGTAAFVDVANDDYQLTASSSAVDRGVDAGIRSDYFGDVRPQQGGFDIGYDESPFRRLEVGLEVSLEREGNQAVAPGSVVTWLVTITNTGELTVSVAQISVAQISVTLESLLHSAAEPQATSAACVVPLSLPVAAVHHCTLLQPISGAAGEAVNVHLTVSGSGIDQTSVNRTATKAVQLSSPTNDEESEEPQNRKTIFLPLVVR